MLGYGGNTPVSVYLPFIIWTLLVKWFCSILCPNLIKLLWIQLI